MKNNKSPTNIEFVRNNKIVKKLILIDGFLRSGKSMVGPILGSFAGVEIIRSEPILESLPLFYHFDKISRDAAIALLRQELDMKLYNSMISRNTNFRFNDITGVFRNVNSFRYFKRLFFKDGNIVLERIRTERSIFQVEVHDMLQFIDLYFEALGEGLRFIEMVRHPVDLVFTKTGPAFENCLKANPRHWGHLIISKKGEAPHYAFGWIDEFVNETPMNRAIKILKRQTEKARMKYKTLSKNQESQILFIPFEKFATFPYKYLDLISNFIDSEVTGKTKRALKMQKVPRIINPVVKENKMKLIKEKASKECLDILDDLINEYEQRES